MLKKHSAPARCVIPQQLDLLFHDFRGAQHAQDVWQINKMTPVNFRFFFFLSYLQLVQLSRAHTLLLTGGGNRWSGWDHKKISVSDSETFIRQQGGGSNQSALRDEAPKLLLARVPAPLYEYGPVCTSCMKSVKGFLLHQLSLLNLPRNQ